MFEATRKTALARLDAFVPKAGLHYAGQRNYDRPGHPDVSGLSPYVRHRLITEDEIVRAILSQHSVQSAGKYIQEVYWRTYWKGWLEMRPSVWVAYQSELKAALNRVQTESGLRSDWEAACTGQTGIDCFDHWAKELAEIGYLHNHARMWFASIWIFTLRLPWTLGADFFMRHLLDGDPASNTLSWRWVGGLQTQGKTYLARRENIAKFTDGRFDPAGLATFAAPLEGSIAPTPVPIHQSDPIEPHKRTGLLITDEDMSPEWLHDNVVPVCTGIFNDAAGRSPLQIAPHIQTFVDAGLDDAANRLRDRIEHIEIVQDITEWARANDLDQIVTSYAPVGPTAQAISLAQTPLRSAGVTLAQLIRSSDSRAWPHATKGFFKFKDHIPKLISAID